MRRGRVGSYKYACLLSVFFQFSGGNTCHVMSEMKWFAKEEFFWFDFLDILR